MEHLIPKSRTSPKRTQNTSNHDRTDDIPRIKLKLNPPVNKIKIRIKIGDPMAALDTRVSRVGTEDDGVVDSGPERTVSV